MASTTLIGFAKMSVLSRSRYSVLVCAVEGFPRKTLYWREMFALFFFLERRIGASSASNTAASCSNPFI